MCRSKAFFFCYTFTNVKMAKVPLSTAQRTKWPSGRCWGAEENWEQGEVSVLIECLLFLCGFTLFYMPSKSSSGLLKRKTRSLWDKTRMNLGRTTYPTQLQNDWINYNGDTSPLKTYAVKFIKKVSWVHKVIKHLPICFQVLYHE